MSEERFSDPKVAIDRVYTRGGDDGETSVVGGDRLPKDDLRVEVYGTVDELNAVLGLCRSTAAASMALADFSALTSELWRCQQDCFNLGSLLATPPEKIGASQARIRDEDISRLEASMDALNAELAPLRSFVLPGGARLEAQLHVARAVCRRAERCCVTLWREVPETDAAALRYLNRLGDWLFVAARWAAHALSAEESLWDPNAETPGA